MAAYLAGQSALPDETVNYLASVAPRLGAEVAMSGALAAFAGGTAAAGFGQSDTSEADRAYAGGGMTGQDYYASSRTASVANDPSARAFDGGGLVTPDAPTGALSGQATPVVTTASLLGREGDGRSAVLRPVAASGGGEWSIQVGAFPDPANSEAATAEARVRAGALLVGARPVVTPVQRAGILYRARLLGLSAGNAAAACTKLSHEGMACFTVPPGS